MNALKTLFVILVAILSLAGCGEQPSPNTTNEQLSQENIIGVWVDDQRRITFRANDVEFLSIVGGERVREPITGTWKRQRQTFDVLTLTFPDKRDRMLLTFIDDDTIELGSLKRPLILKRSK